MFQGSAAVSNQSLGLKANPFPWLTAALPNSVFIASGHVGKHPPGLVVGSLRRHDTRRPWPACRPAPWWRSRCSSWPPCGHTTCGTPRRNVWQNWPPPQTPRPDTCCRICGCSPPSLFRWRCRGRHRPAIAGKLPRPANRLMSPISIVMVSPRISPTPGRVLSGIAGQRPAPRSTPPFPTVAMLASSCSMCWICTPGDQLVGRMFVERLAPPAGHRP